MIDQKLTGKIFFASDLHLGVPDKLSSKNRENRFIEWLNFHQHEMQELYLVGDIFDFWFDYRKVVPKGYVRLLGKLAEIADSGIPVHYFRGNHDLWIKDYFLEEIGVQFHTEPIKKSYNGKRFLIGHGDGLGPGDYGFKFIKKIFTNPFFQWLYSWVHPDIGISIAQYWSKTSRYSNGNVKEERFLGAEKEWLAQYCNRVLEREHFDYFIFGHRHLPIELQLSNNSTYFNLGDWITYNTYGEFDGTNMYLHTFNSVQHNE